MCGILCFYLVIRYFIGIFVAEFAALITVLCCKKERMRYVYSRKRQVDKLPLGLF